MDLAVPLFQADETTPADLCQAERALDVPAAEILFRRSMLRPIARHPNANAPPIQSNAVANGFKRQCAGVVEGTDSRHNGYAFWKKRAMIAQRGTR